MREDTDCKKIDDWNRSFNYVNLFPNTKRAIDIIKDADSNRVFVVDVDFVSNDILRVLGVEQINENKDNIPVICVKLFKGDKTKVVWFGKHEVDIYKEK